MSNPPRPGTDFGNPPKPRTDSVDRDIWAAGRAMLEADMQRKPLVSIDAPRREPLDDRAAAALVSMVFETSTAGHPPHVVSIRRGTNGNPDLVSCICAATLSLETRPAGCWAMKAARAILGIHQP